MNAEGMQAANLGTKYVFPGAYGGSVLSDKPPQIHDMICELRRRLTLDAKKAPGVMFPVKSAKELHQKLAQALNDLNMVASPIAQDFHYFDTDKIPKNETKSGNPVFRTLIHCKTTVRLVASDTSYHDVVGSGHGGDGDDKAGGKADTFSWKTAVLKGITVPSDDLDDTDDEQQSAPVQTRAPAPTQKSETPASNAAALDKVTASIANIDPKDPDAVTKLEAIRDSIKSGEAGIHGSEKMVAAKSYAAKMKEVKGEPAA